MNDRQKKLILIAGVSTTGALMNNFWPKIAPAIIAILNNIAAISNRGSLSKTGTGLSAGLGIGISLVCLSNYLNADVLNQNIDLNIKNKNLENTGRVASEKAASAETKNYHLEQKLNTYIAENAELRDQNIHLQNELIESNQDNIVTYIPHKQYAYNLR